MKPTDIWTNHPMPMFKPMCKNGDSCHVPAPRGSKTGTQGLKNAKERSRIPRKLCEHIVDICEMRTCEVCGEPMIEGFCVDDDRYFDTEECLNRAVSKETYLKLYNKNRAYWTNWADEMEG